MNTSPVTVSVFARWKREQRRISMLTAYDFPSAALVDEAGIDAILVGDSLGNVVQGKATTVPVTLDQMIYHGEMVCRAVKRALVVVDLPFGSYQASARSAVESAIRVLKETGCTAVKLECSQRTAHTIAALADAGIAVMGHCGFRPQSIHQQGKVQISRDFDTVLADAKAAEEAGAFAIVLECVASDVAAEVTQQLKIPTIGIGAGPGCDGQVLVFHDVFGLSDGKLPRFVKTQANLRQQMLEAAKVYRQEVERGLFPDEGHSYK